MSNPRPYGWEWDDLTVYDERERIHWRTYNPGSGRGHFPPNLQDDGYGIRALVTRHAIGEWPETAAYPCGPVDWEHAGPCPPRGRPGSLDGPPDDDGGDEPDR